jgi:hypothetical protein
MKEATESRKKKCAVCEKEYPEEDNYCGDDGSVLEQARALGGNHLSPSAGTPMTGDDVCAEPNSVLQH